MTDRLALIRKLNHILLEEMPEYRTQTRSFSDEIVSQRRLLRSLMNVRPPLPIKPSFLYLQDQLLAAECEEKGGIDVMTLPTTKDKRMIIWHASSHFMAVLIMRFTLRPVYSSGMNVIKL